MSISLPSGFNILNLDPIDSRFVVTNETARLGFSGINVYEGLIVYQQDNDTLYVLTDTSNWNNNTGWTEIGSGLAAGQGPTNSIQFKTVGEGTISGSANLLFDNTIPKLTVNSGFVAKRTATSIDLQLTPAHYIIGVDTSNTAAQITLSLPDAATLSDGQMYVIKDEGGMADIYNIVISCSGSQTIDGEQSVVIESPHAAINLYTDGSSRWFVY